MPVYVGIASHESVSNSQPAVQQLHLQGLWHEDSHAGSIEDHSHPNHVPARNLCESWNDIVRAHPSGGLQVHSVEYAPAFTVRAIHPFRDDTDQQLPKHETGTASIQRGMFELVWQVHGARTLHPQGQIPPPAETAYRCNADLSLVAS
ncbi:hypothetical protein EMCG_00432 [[Emmonsia] crescens]|uniref:Uncharacterized protein n=1 Tax=[Emmonsia] crescens TaxID=73230 RepID=A0A0G2HWV3_9EURO|nr:hypothetical protein EMCG_00432 [Emmonsia crescens UAMH 3008]